MFATGGFTHDPELRKNFLHGAVYGGCAAPTNEGDFVRISSALDVQLRNMNYSWMAPISLDKAIAKRRLAHPASLRRRGIRCST